MKRNYILSEFLTLTIRRPEDGYEISIKLYSHYTAIVNNSGNGKTHFLEYVRAHRYDGVLEFDIPNGFELSFALDEATLVTAMNQTARQIILVDEPSVCLLHKHIRQVNNSFHVFVLVSRGQLFHNSYPLNGMYSITETTDRVFEIATVKELPICEQIQDGFILATEAGENKSEHRLLSNFIEGVVALGSNSCIARYVENLSCDTVIFCDLGNIGFEYENIQRALLSCKYKVYFYDYACYEQLLIESPVLRSLGDVCINPFSKMSIEKVFESELKHLTKNTGFDYDHKKCTCPAKLVACSVDDLFASDCGKVLRDFLCKCKESVVDGISAF